MKRDRKKANPMRSRTKRVTDAEGGAKGFKGYSQRVLKQAALSFVTYLPHGLRDGRVRVEVKTSFPESEEDRLEALLRKDFSESKAKVLEASIVGEVVPRFTDCLSKCFSQVGEQPEKQIDLLTVESARCIEAALAEFSDSLTCALFASRKPITDERKGRILNATLQFSSTLKTLAVACLAMSMGRVSTRRSKGQVSFRVESAQLPETLRTALADRWKRFVPVWRNTAELKVTWRCLQSPLPSRAAPRQDPLKALIATIKAKNPGFSQRQICSRLDAKNVPLPQRWQQAGERSWVSALGNLALRNRMKKFISAIKPTRPTKPFRPRR